MEITALGNVIAVAPGIDEKATAELDSRCEFMRMNGHRWESGGKIQVQEIGVNNPGGVPDTCSKDGHVYGWRQTRCFCGEENRRPQW